jgi:hypothetical protein
MTEEKDITARVHAVAKQHGIQITDEPAVMKKLNLLFPAYTSNEEIETRLAAIVKSNSELFGNPQSSTPEKVQGLDTKFVQYLASRHCSIETFFSLKPTLRLSYQNLFEQSIKDASKPTPSELERRRLLGKDQTMLSARERATLADLNGGVSRRRAAGYRG